MTVISIAEACRQAWVSGRVEVIAGVCDGLRLSHGFDYAQIHRCFCESLGREISLSDLDAILYAADEGYTGSVLGLAIPLPRECFEGRTRQ